MDLGAGHVMKAFFYDWEGLNVWLFYVINNVHSDFIDRVMLFGTALADRQYISIYVGMVAFIAVWSIHSAKLGTTIAGQRETRWLLVLSVLSIGFLVDSALVIALKHVLALPRPPLALPPGTVHIVGVGKLNHSFPSGHTVIATLIVGSLWPLLNRPGRAVAVVFVLWAALSRISLGMHFPVDVLGGFVLSLIVVIIVRFFIARALRFSFSH